MTDLFKALGPVPRLMLTGRLVRLGLRTLAAAAACWLAVAAVGWQPASAAVMAGALTWLLRMGRCDRA